MLMGFDEAMSLLKTDEQREALKRLMLRRYGNKTIDTSDMPESDFKGAMSAEEYFKHRQSKPSAQDR